MGLRVCVFAVVAMLAACQRTQAPPSAAPSATPMHTTATAPSTPAASVAAPAAAVSPGAEADDDDDDEDDVDKPWGQEFEINADANWYFGFAPMDVTFGATPLNGSPPYTYTWEFADGSPQTTGDRAQHRYEKVGTYAPYVVGKDGKGETYRVSFIIAVVTREEYARRKGPDAPMLQQSPAPSSSP